MSSSPSSSYADAQKVRVLRKLGQVELVPWPALLVHVGRARPCARRLFATLELRRVAQAERAIDEKRRGEAKSLAQQQKARAVAQKHRRAPEKGGEIDDAVEIAADVRHA